MKTDNGIIVLDDYPSVALQQPLSAEQARKLGQLQWRWTIAYNRAKAAPRTHYTELHKDQCEEVLKLLDIILKAPVIGDPK
jgi:hypothetical protein